MSDHAGFLARIIQNRDDDLPRKIYADWLMEHGEEARGEFIIVQLELDRLKKVQYGCAGSPERNGAMHRHSGKAGQVIHGVQHDGDPSRPHHHHDERCANPRPDLLKRLVELLDGPRPDVYQNEVCWFNSGDGTENWKIIFRPKWTRGFVSGIECAAADWLRFADQIAAQTPLERVTLTTPIERIETVPSHEPRGIAITLRTGGDLYQRVVPQSEFPQNYDTFRFSDYSQQVHCLLMCLWPTIQFTLSPTLHVRRAFDDNGNWIPIQDARPRPSHYPHLDTGILRRSIP